MGANLACPAGDVNRVLAHASRAKRAQGRRNALRPPRKTIFHSSTGPAVDRWPLGPATSPDGGPGGGEKLTGDVNALSRCNLRIRGVGRGLG